MANEEFVCYQIWKPTSHKKKKKKLDSHIDFFFLRRKNILHYYSWTGKLVKTEEFKSSGTNSIQTCKGKENFALWVKTRATALLPNNMRERKAM